MAKKLYVGGLPYSTTNEGLKAAFDGAGEVVSATVITDRETGKSRGFGFVEMADDAGAQNAVQTLNGTELEGRKISVSEARPREDRGNDRRGNW